MRCHPHTQALPTLEGGLGVGNLSGSGPDHHHSIHEVMEVIEVLCREIARVDAPILIMHGARDHTADPKSAAYLYENVVSSRREKVILPDAGHLLPLDTGIRERVFERTAAFLSEDTAR